MRRLALALTVGLTLPLLAGCPVSPCVEPTLEVQWQLQNLAGQDATCTAAGVATMNVIVDGQQRSNIPCTDGRYRYEGLPAGPHRVTVEGRSSTGLLLNRAWYDTTLAECGTTVDLARPGRGTLNVFYAMSPVNQCWAEGDTTFTSGYMWFELTDSVYGTWAAVTAASAAADRTFYACGNFVAQPETYRPIAFNVPFGEYTLEWIKDVKFPAVDPPIRADLYQLCTPTTVLVDEPGTTTINATLTPVTATTPACP